MTVVSLQSGYTVNFHVSGSGPALVLLHGFTGSAHSWGAFGSLLAKHFEVIAVDLPGHGQNDSAANLQHYAMPQCVNDTVEAVHLLGFGRAHWLGYSMGGRTALHVAAAHPETVRSLSLIGASPGLDCVEDRTARRSADELLAARIERDGVAAFVDYWENIPLFATQGALPEETRVRIQEGRLHNTTVGLANSLRGMGTGSQEPLHTRLATLIMPALIMAGELDHKFAEIGQEMAAEMPRARFEAIAGAGHASHIERPTECTEFVASFITSLDSQGEN